MGWPEGWPVLPGNASINHPPCSEELGSIPHKHCECRVEQDDFSKDNCGAVIRERGNGF